MNNGSRQGPACRHRLICRHMPLIAVPPVSPLHDSMPETKQADKVLSARSSECDDNEVTGKHTPAVAVCGGYAGVSDTVGEPHGPLGVGAQHCPAASLLALALALSSGGYPAQARLLHMVLTHIPAWQSVSQLLVTACSALHKEPAGSALLTLPLCRIDFHMRSQGLLAARENAGKQLMREGLNCSLLPDTGPEWKPRAGD